MTATITASVPIGATPVIILAESGAAAASGGGGGSSDPAVAAALGAPTDSAWSGTGSGTIDGILKAIYSLTAGVRAFTLNGMLPAGTNLIGSVNDLQSAAYSTANVITPGTPIAAGRSLGYICTTTGNITLTLSSGTLTLPIVTAGGALQTLPFAVTNVALGSGTAGTFWNLA